MDQKSGNFEKIDFFLQEGLENYGGFIFRISQKLVTIKLKLMFHIFHGEKPKSNLMLPCLCNVPW